MLLEKTAQINNPRKKKVHCIDWTSFCFLHFFIGWLSCEKRKKKKTVHKYSNHCRNIGPMCSQRKQYIYWVHSPSKDINVECAVCCSNAESLSNRFNMKAESVLVHSCCLHHFIEINQNTFLISVLNYFQSCLRLWQFPAPLDWRREAQSIKCFLGCCANLISEGDLRNAKNKITCIFIWFPLVWKIYLLFYFYLTSYQTLLQKTQQNQDGKQPCKYDGKLIRIKYTREEKRHCCYDGTTEPADTSAPGCECKTETESEKQLWICHHSYLE